MITTLQHGITIQSAAITAIVQSCEVTEKQEVSKVMGMHSDGTTQVKKIFPHTKTNDFSVEGKGDLTLATGGAGAHNLSLISGGLYHISEMKYSQKLSEESTWSYKGEHFPYAA